MTWNEKTVIRSMVEGVLQGPQTFAGAWFAPLMILPVGVRWNEGAGYYEYRDPQVWLSADMCTRCNGLPVLGGAIEGPINSAEFGKRVIGTVMTAYAKDDALMALRASAMHRLCASLRLARLIAV